MASKNEVRITFAGDDKSLSRTLGKLNGQADKTGSRLQSLGRIAKIGAAAGLGAMAGAAKVGWDEFMEGQRVAAQTNAVLRSTGGVANVTAQQVDDLASALMRKSGTDDEVIKSGANLLLTFTNIRNGAGANEKIFNRATQAALDMSVAFGQDMKSSAIQLGKALNDPIKGVSALSRVGVSFTQDQKNMIKAMVEAGNTAGAQKLILQELERQVGGSAAAYGQTLPGKIDIAKQTLSNFAGEIVGHVVPVLAGMVNWVAQHWPTIQAVIDTAWSGAKQVTFAAIDWFKVNIVPVFDGIISAAQAVWNRLGPIVTAAFDTVKSIVGPALRVIKDTVGTVMALLRGDWSAAWNGLKGIVSGVFDGVKNLITGAGKTLAAAARAIATTIADAFLAPIRAIISVVQGVVDTVRNLLGSNSQAQREFRNFQQRTPGSLAAPFGQRIGRRAHGGIVTSPELSWIGERGPEAVIPLTNRRRANEVMAQAGLAGGGGNTYVTINTAADPTAVVEALRQYVRFNGPVTGVVAA